eukprot:CAMPEP_0201517678 /NCGR_PEP_ID=MMETSP0161_2-20130828/8735_1 /ASSEMBLY_ACC=CAM_ASM_000251 /TAXON_ID=180227 /ORGANISM="Neoparamoeba aestuarina, Strain SoJaBio B1-5/56/2" /LENGTH=69 /DNA_ID=CAMNT_0047915255 /DNA_START=349 /DNA_END=558 /DNA_ORIENTATION=+
MNPNNQVFNPFQTREGGGGERKEKRKRTEREDENESFFQPNKRARRGSMSPKKQHGVVGAGWGGRMFFG